MVVRAGLELGGDGGGLIFGSRGEFREGSPVCRGGVAAVEARTGSEELLAQGSLRVLALGEAAGPQFRQHTVDEVGVRAGDGGVDDVDAVKAGTLPLFEAV